MEQVFGCERSNTAPGSLPLFTMKTMQCKARNQIVEPERRYVMGLSPMIPRMADQSRHMVRGGAVAEPTPEQDASPWSSVGLVQGVHDGSVAPAVTGNDQRRCPRLFDQRLAERCLLSLKLFRRVLQRVVTIITM